MTLSRDRESFLQSSLDGNDEAGDSEKNVLPELLEARLEDNG